MIKVGVVGASGRTGQYVTQALQRCNEAVLHAAIVSEGSGAIGSVVPGSDVRFSSSLNSLVGADVVIEFTNPDTSVKVAQWCAKQGIAVLIATTGHSNEQRKSIESLGSEATVGITPNTSVGAAVLTHLAVEAKRFLGDAFDVEVLDIHHRMKKDAPSGTARTLVHHLVDEEHVVFGRSELRKPGELGVVAMRGGDVVGDHTVYFLGEGERIEISHRVSTRAVFGEGAVSLALRLSSLPKGVYSAKQLIGL